MNSGEYERINKRTKSMDKKKQGYNLGISLLIFAGAIAVGYCLRLMDLAETGIIVNTVSVMAIVWFTNSFIVGIAASVTASCIFNFLLVDPIYTLQVNNPNYYVTIITMTIVAIITSIEAKGAEKDAQIAREKEAETKNMYLLTSRLTDAFSIEEIVDISMETICSGMQCGIGYLYFDDKGQAEKKFRFKFPDSDEVTEIPVEENIDEIKKKLDELEPDYYLSDRYCDLPLYGSDKILGTIRVKLKDLNKMDDSQRKLLLAMTENVGLAIDRVQNLRQMLKSREDVAKERYRVNLLRAISHDIRTPLTGIIGTSEMLVHSIGMNSEESIKMAEKIKDDAEWLHSLVENILNLTRLEDGEVSLKKDVEAMEEVVAAAISHVLGQGRSCDIEAVIPEEVIMAPMNAKLIEQVIVNLLENAIKHSMANTCIYVEIWEDKKADSLWCAVRDSGEGISEEDLENIFQPFYTNDKNRKRSFGLGLAICDTIIKAHNGEIMARNRTDSKGAEFIFSLPLSESEGSRDE